MCKHMAEFCLKKICFGFTVKHVYNGHSQYWFPIQITAMAGHMYCRKPQGEHSAILLTFNKVPFVI